MDDYKNHWVVKVNKIKILTSKVKKRIINKSHRVKVNLLCLTVILSLVYAKDF